MTTTPGNMLVLKNEAGDYYVLPLELLEQGRVSAEHAAEVERIFAAATADDVAGLSLNFVKIKFTAVTMGERGVGSSTTTPVSYTLPTTRTSSG